MGEKNYHTPITGTPDLRTALNTALGELDSAVGFIGRFNAAVIGDTYSSGNNGSSPSATSWNQRTINNEQSDDDAIVALSSNEFTPVAGTYLLYVTGTTYSVQENRLRLYNVTQTSVEAYGICSKNDNEQVAVTLTHILTANGTDAYRLDHYTYDTGGFLGIQDGVGGTAEHYLQVMMVRFA